MYKERLGFCKTILAQLNSLDTIVSELRYFTGVCVSIEVVWDKARSTGIARMLNGHRFIDARDYDLLFQPSGRPITTQRPQGSWFTIEWLLRVEDIATTMSSIHEDVTPEFVWIKALALDIARELGGARFIEAHDLDKLFTPEDDAGLLSAAA